MSGTGGTAGTPVTEAHDAHAETGSPADAHADAQRDAIADAAGDGRQDAMPDAGTDAASHVPRDSAVRDDAAPAPGRDAAPDARVDAGPPPECTPGETQQVACGNCGVRVRTCQGGKLGAWSDCSAEGPCAPGSTESQSCGSGVGECREGVRVRSCGNDCNWGAFSACGSGYVAPTAEVCGDGRDNNCDGVIDDGCTCPVIAGGPAQIALSSTVSKLIGLPDRCLVVALDTASASQLVVMSAASKQVSAHIPLPYQASDMDLSANGQWLVVSHPGQPAISVIDLDHLGVAAVVQTVYGQSAIEVDDHGRAYYTRPGDVFFRRIDLDAGVHSDFDISGPIIDDAMSIELSRGGTTLYIGDTVDSPAGLWACDVSVGLMSPIDSSTLKGSGTNPSLFLAPGQQHIYFFDYQLDPADLGIVYGHPGEHIFAEDAAGTFAVGQNHLFDARLVRPVASLPATPVSGAALMAGDRELWMLAGGTVRVLDVQSLLAGVALGQRAQTVGALSTYTFTALIADPLRPVLYGVDAQKEVVVAIDAATLQPTAALATASGPTTLAIDTSGAVLYVGHQGAFGLLRVDLATFTGAFVPTAAMPFAVAALPDGRVASVAQDQFSMITIQDGASGAALWTGSQNLYQAALVATADGKTLFTGEQGTFAATRRYAFDRDRLAQAAVNSGNSLPNYADRVIAASADGSVVCFSKTCLDGATLQVPRFSTPDDVVTVTRDGRLAVTTRTVYRVADGAARAALPTAGAVQAASADSRTLYVATPGAITPVDLGGL
jgi:hypothetical protein